MNSLKEVCGFKDYYIDISGNVYSNKTGKLIIMTPWEDSKKRYLMIGLMKDGKRHKLLVHRLVAINFIENPNILPCINHKDNNPKNNSVENLEWCTQKENIHYSYSTMSQYRNQVPCNLFKDGTFVKRFENIKEAAEYGSKEFGCSFSGLCRNLKSKNILLKRCND